MVTAELSHRPMLRLIVGAGGTVLGLAALGAALGQIAPALAGHTPPHAVLAGTIGDAASILQNNVRVLAVPFLFGLLRLQQSRLGRRAGDLLTLAIAAASAIPVGIELDRWRDRLLPYVPQLPIEWAALVLAVTAWLTIRTGHVDRRQLTVLAITTLLLLIAAAAVEAFCTPHTHDPRSIQPPRPTRFTSSPSPWAPVVAVASDCAPAVAGSLQGRALPSPHSLRFRSATEPALTGLTTTTDPQGGITT
jgi:hypothetical protein